MTRVFLAIGLGIGIFFAAYWLLSDHTLDWTYIAFIIGFPAVGFWGWRLVSIGEAQLSEAGLSVRSRTHTQTYPWEDIVSIRSDTADQASSGDNRTVYHALGVDLSNRVVVIDLRRSFRQDILFNRLGTRIRGIPMGKTITIEPDDTDGFVKAASQFLSA